MSSKINLGNVCMNEMICEQLLIVKNIVDIANRNNIKLWFNGTYGVVGYYGYFFSTPHDVDCGVLRKEHTKFKGILADNGYSLVSEKDNGKFLVTSFQKGTTVVELGTFDEDLGDNFADIEGIHYPIPDNLWLANCYRITHTKERRRGENDLDRAIFLESINISKSTAK